ncbi:MAG: enoyl-CoA hydratase [Desulfobacteraceae bacterium]|nr:MAG: enoyl-CoA hydratase [Desulfobacteraceae bacterium]
MTQPVLFEVKDHVAIITLNRPEKRNAISQQLLIDLYNHLEKIANDPEIRVGIITGAGDTFCAGLDLSRLMTDNLMDPRGDGKDLLDIFANLDKPIIGAINGHAITGGFELALNCDFLIASENASFADTHAKVGIHPGWGMTQLLQKAVGVRMARQMSFTCTFYSAQKMLAVGLVNEVVPKDQLMKRCMEIAIDIASVNQGMLRVVKNLIELGNEGTLENGLHLERKGFQDFLRKSGVLKI